MRRPPVLRAGEADLEDTVLRSLQRILRSGSDPPTAGIIAKGIARDPQVVLAALVRLELKGIVHHTELPRSTGGAHIRYWQLVA